MRCGGLLPLNSVDDASVHYFSREWLRKATNIFWKKEGNVDWKTKVPSAADLFFDAGDDEATSDNEKAPHYGRLSAPVCQLIRSLCWCGNPNHRK